MDCHERCSCFTECTRDTSAQALGSRGAQQGPHWMVPQMVLVEAPAGRFLDSPKSASTTMR